MSATQCFVGIDVAKAQLDIALRPTGERWAVANDDVGIAALVERLQADAAHLDCARSHGWLPAGRGGGAGRGRPSGSGGRIRAKRATLPKPPDSWPRRMPSTRAPWPMLPRPCGRRPGPCRTPRPTNSAPCWRGGGNWSPCGRPNRIALGMHPHGSRRTSRRISPGSTPG